MSDAAARYEGVARAYQVLIGDAEGQEGLDRDGLLKTPHRAARAWRELTAGYTMEVELTTFEAESDQIVTVTNIPFYSLCEHHLLPFHGTVSFAYLPQDLQLGLSKFARAAELVSRRLQTQERMTKELADLLEGVLEPAGLIVIARAEHLCMAMRGVQVPGHTTTTSEARGVMRESGITKGEAMRLMGA